MIYNIEVCLQQTKTLTNINHHAVVDEGGAIHTECKQFIMRWALGGNFRYRTNLFVSVNLPVGRCFSCPPTTEVSVRCQARTLRTLR